MTDRRPATRPPRWGLAIARRLVPPERRAEIEGDLIEAWACRHAVGRRDLRRAFWRDVASLRRPFTGRPVLPQLRVGASYMLNDLRYALRLAQRQPVFTMLIVATLALGIGASTTVFTVADRVLVRPLAFPHPEQLMWVEHTGFSFANNSMHVSRAVAESPAFSDIGLFATGGLNLGTGPSPSRLRVTGVSAGFLRALGVAPITGRLFTDREDIDSATVVLLGYDTWQTHFGGDPNIVGQSILLNGRSFLVTGVMPRDFVFPEHSEAWVPVAADIQLTGAAMAPQVVARLAPGVDRARAEAVLLQLETEQHARNPERDFDPATLTPLQAHLGGTARPTLLLLAGVVTLLLLTTTANVAGLLLSRMRGREQEIAVRAAIGASRARLAMQLMVESLALTTVAGGIGLVLATWALAAVRTSVPDFVPDVAFAIFDARLAAISITVMIVSALLFGIGPAIVAARGAATRALRSSRAVTDGGSWLRHGLVVAQVGTAVVLLTVSGAALLTLITFMRVDAGFHNGRAIAFELTLPQSRYESAAAVASVGARIVERLAETPGIRRAGASTRPPGSRSVGVGVELRAEGEPEADGGRRQYALQLTATPDYFATVGIPLLAGRPFDAADRTGAPPVVILSETAARALWGRPADAVGRRLAGVIGGKPAPSEVVGVVADVRLRDLRGEPRPQLYRPFAQRPPFGAASFVVDTDLADEAAVGAVRAAILSVDPTLPAYNIIRIENVQARYLTTERLTVWLTSFFALTALALCAIGLYGVLSQLVARRTREIGIRMALGADRSAVRRDVVMAGLRVALLGVAIGVAAAGGTSRAIAAYVPGLTALPVAAIAALAGVLLIVALFAAWLPARRASAVDPVIALRAD